MISAEARDALYSLAMDLLSGIASRESARGIDPAFSQDLRLLLESLSDIEVEAVAELRLDRNDLKRVMEGIRGSLPGDVDSSRSSPRTRLVARTCGQVLAQIGEANE
jgi:hypothetical protein